MSNRTATYLSDLNIQNGRFIGNIQGSLTMLQNENAVASQSMLNFWAMTLSGDLYGNNMTLVTGLTEIYQDVGYIYSLSKSMPKVVNSTKLDYLNLNMSLNRLLHPATY